MLGISKASALGGYDDVCVISYDIVCMIRDVIGYEYRTRCCSRLLLWTLYCVDKSYQTIFINSPYTFVCILHSV